MEISFTINIFCKNVLNINILNTALFIRWKHLKIYVYIYIFLSFFCRTYYQSLYGKPITLFMYNIINYIILLKLCILLKLYYYIHKYHIYIYIYIYIIHIHIYIIRLFIDMLLRKLNYPCFSSSWSAWQVMKHNCRSTLHHWSYRHGIVTRMFVTQYLFIL